MSKQKGLVAGKRRAGTHTTLTDAAREIVAIVIKAVNSARISPGFITSGLRAPSRGSSVRITRKSGCLLLNIRGNTTAQEVRIYCSDLEDAEQAIRSAFQREGICMRGEASIA